ncbi:ankyrin repeat and SOCS box protein 8 [Athene cunicularia]|uniref:ankyrin repeat and SOCS box protein 8 n=1 Tax=Athene cunicularia TaxID=194338 RepID=UPI000EF733B4|nr:ankyrin repeat and SOCS box protein 8 [Athene cunicularia]
MATLSTFAPRPQGSQSEPPEPGGRAGRGRIGGEPGEGRGLRVGAAGDWMKAKGRGAGPPRAGAEEPEGGGASGDAGSRIGGEVNALDGYNRTALHYAAEKDETCVEILLEYGANPNALDGNKDTPLHWAAFKNNAECVRALLENGALVNARDYNNDTPLSWAAMKGNLESVSILLDFGAEVRVVNLKGQTPISRLVALLVRGLGTEREDSCFDLLHRAIGHFELRKNGSMPWEVTRDQQLCEKLTLLCSAPGTLQTLSRYAVRRSLGVRFLPEAVKQLPLPTSLKEYVLLLS